MPDDRSAGLSPLRLDDIGDVRRLFDGQHVLEQLEGQLVHRTSEVGVLDE